MKVLLVHNWYGSSAPSGENAVVLAEKQLLQANGIDVIEYFKFSDGIRSIGFLGKILGGLATPFNPFTYFQFRALLRRERPDVVHVHNFFPLISPAVFYAAHHQGVASVMTLHNYRIGCGAGLPFRDQETCLHCLEGQSVRPLLKFRCYRNSLAASLPMAAMIALHRRLRTWSRRVDLFITLTDFYSQIMRVTGLIPENSMRKKPQFMANPPEPAHFLTRPIKALYVGRISMEKGVSTLLEAWRQWGADAPRLHIVGDGPDLDTLKSTFGDVNVHWHGKLPADQTLEVIRSAQLLIIPSICFEGFPMVVREALACAVPILASHIGPMEEFVLPAFGELFKPGSPAQLLDKARGLLGEGSPRLADMSQQARIEFDCKYTAHINFERLMSIYQEAIAIHKRKRSA
ncbi:glycosyltransferase family 4 protein [Aquabacterium sp.]|uniref:glycosyltransferase family 4 protein n=1 Tax=Aquabacterium sp. TaxID=1872578 RepID=UPI004037E883